MLVVVDRLVNDRHEVAAYVDVQGAQYATDRDKARQIAFRFVHKRSEKDYNELVHMTRPVEIQTVSPEVGEVLLSHVT